MSKLEDLLPELAGMFVAQESAMENVVSLLTTQVAQLIQDSDAQNRRVVALEGSQKQLQNALLSLRTAHDSLADQQSAAQASHTVNLGVMAASVQGVQLTLQQQLQDVEGKWQNVEARLEAAGAGPSETEVIGLVGNHLTAVETKLTAHLEHRLLETSNRSYLQAQHTEEAMKTELEMLEKKFEYLSRVKMEIKDLNKKIEKQDQTLDDMRMGMELLAKNIGTDESDNEEDNNRKPLRRVDKAEVMNVMKRISLSGTDIQAKINENAALLASLTPPPAAAAVAEEASTAQETTTTMRTTRSKSTSAVPAQQAAFTRSKTMDMYQNPRATESVEATGQIATSRGKRGPIPIPMPLKSATSPPPDDGNAESTMSPHTPAAISETTEDTGSELAHGEDTDEAANNVSSSPETTPPAAADIVEEFPEDLNESSDATQPSPAEEEIAVQDEELLQPAEKLEEQTPEPEICEVVPEQAPEVVAEEEEKETEESDHVVKILSPATSRARLGSREKQQQHNGDILESGPSHPSMLSMMQHMPTTPNLAMLYPTFDASTAMIHSRRTTRMLKLQNSNVRKDSMLDLSRSETRTPMAKGTIKSLWRHMFTRLVQLKRLQILNGTSPDKIFRKANISVGARVKRLEETTADLEEMGDVLEVNIQQNSQSVQQLAQSIAQYQVDVDAKVNKLSEDAQLQSQMIIGVEEKLDLIELDLRRVRSSSRRDSSQTASSDIVNALTSQQQELAGKFSDHVSAFQTVERVATKLSELELPALAARFEAMLHDLRHETDYKSKELAKELYKSIDRAREAQVATGASLLKRMNDFVERLYRDVMNLSRAHVVSLEMVRSAKIPSTTTTTTSKKKLTLFDVSLEMLQSIFLSFQNDCKLLQNEEEDESMASSTRGVLLERALDFLDQLEKLKEQSAKAKSSAIAVFGGGDESDTVTFNTGSSSFTNHLVLMTVTQLKALESLLASDERQEDNEDAEGNSSDVSYQIKDLVVQLRSVLVLLFLHAELLDPHQKLQVVLSTQEAMHKEIRVHDFSISQLNTVGATVKMLNTRLDSFLEMSFSFAKDEDVKKSIQEMLNSSENMRDNLSQQLETTHFEAQKRDEILERELTQLVARVNKKLDKDELLWTQEVIERQLQSVVKSSLGEEDLIDIHRLLRNKLDKTYFNALLAEQRNRATENGGGGGGAGGVHGASSNGAPGNSPLIGAKCISCNNELPPTKAMIKSVVKDQVHQEVAKTLARQQQQPGMGGVVAPGASSFNASTHRSMEKYKKELLMAALQQQQQKSRK